MTQLYRGILTGACAAAVTFAPIATAHAAKTSFVAVLNAGQEVPVGTSGSFGNAHMTFDPTSDQLCYAISYSALGSAEIAAHFHGPAAPGADAGVVADISPPPDGPSPLGSPKQGCVTLDADAAKALKKGLLYINIHSTDEPGGEIRGQVVPVKPKY